MRKPFNGNYRVTWNFQGHVKDKTHDFDGVDFGLPENTPLYAIEKGTIYSGTDTYKALYIVLTSLDGQRKWYYWHLNKIIVHSGQVDEGQLIGLSGNTGYSTGPHLHLGLKIGEKWVDPLPYINNISYNNNMDNKITAQPGWGLSNIAKAIGYNDWASENAWIRIFEANRGFRGANSWQELNSRLQPGDILNIPQDKQNNVEIDENLKKELEKIRQEKEKLEEQIRKVENENVKKLETLKQEKQKEIEELTKKIEQLQAEVNKVEETKKIVLNFSPSDEETEEIKEKIDVLSDEFLDFVETGKFAELKDFLLKTYKMMRWVVLSYLITIGLNYLSVVEIPVEYVGVVNILIYALKETQQKIQQKYFLDKQI